MKNYSLSGMSTPNMIYFIGDKYSIELNTITGKSLINKNAITKSGLTSLIMKIPLIRGAYLLLYTVLFMINDFLKSIMKLRPIRLAYLIILIGSFFYFLKNVSPQDHPGIATGINLIAGGLLVFIFTFFILFLYSARTNHSIEHKVIGAYDKERNLCLRTIKKQPKEHPRCGGVLVAWYLILYAAFMITTGKEPLLGTTIIIFSTGYELARLAGIRGIVGQTFFMPGYLLQKLTTSKEIPLHVLKRAQKAAITLLRKERQIVSTR